MSYNKINYNNEYNKEHYERLNLLLKKGYKQTIKDKADKRKMSMSEYIYYLVKKDNEK